MIQGRRLLLCHRCRECLASGDRRLARSPWRGFAPFQRLFIPAGRHALTRDCPRPAPPPTKRNGSIHDQRHIASPPAPPPTPHEASNTITRLSRDRRAGFYVTGSCRPTPLTRLPTFPFPGIIEYVIRSTTLPHNLMRSIETGRGYSRVR